MTTKVFLFHLLPGESRYLRPIDKAFYIFVDEHNSESELIKTSLNMCSETENAADFGKPAFRFKLRSNSL